MNGSDCGMFACKFAEYITRDARISFTQVSYAGAGVQPTLDPYTEAFIAGPLR